MQPAEQLDRLADIIITVAPLFLWLIIWLFLHLLYLALLAAPSVVMAVVAFRTAGWRGVVFLATLWFLAWRVVTSV